MGVGGGGGGGLLLALQQVDWYQCEDERRGAQKVSKRLLRWENTLRPGGGEGITET